MLRRPTGLPLHWGFLPYLLSLKSRTKRRVMAANAAKNGWSPARLHAEIRQIEERPPGHGRTVELPATTANAAQQVVREGRLWLARAKKLIRSLRSSELVKAEPRAGESESSLD